MKKGARSARVVRLTERLGRNCLLTEHNCFMWTRRQDRNGYGAFNLYVPGLRDRAHMKTHIVSWILLHCDTDLETADDVYLAYKELTISGLQIDHVCRNRSCFNPDKKHLEVVTHTMNYERRDAHQRAARGQA